MLEIVQEINDQRAPFDERLRAAEKNLGSAIDAYHKGVENRKSGKSSRVQAIKDDVRKMESEGQRLADAEVEALGTGDDARASALESEITKNSAAISEAQRRIRMLEAAKTPGDPEACEAVAVAYQEYRQLLQDGKMLYLSFVQAVEAALDEINKLSENVHQHRDFLCSTFADVDRGRNSFTRQVVGILENEQGAPLDVAHHSAGDDEAAKARYANDSIAGLENTVAGHQLAEKLGIELDPLPEAVEEPAVRNLQTASYSIPGEKPSGADKVRSAKSDSPFGRDW